eukprot:9041638-Pyramimonas_sp.AAC.1
MTKSASSASWAPPTAPWSCSTCSCMNWGDRADCRQCGSTRPTSPRHLRGDVLAAQAVPLLPLRMP